MGKIKHQVERVAFGKLIDTMLNSMEKDREKTLLKAVDLTEKFASEEYGKESFDAARRMIMDENNKWMKYTNRILDEVSPNVLRATALNLGFEAMLCGVKAMHENKEKYGCNIPWVILTDVTSACNLKCTGCWAAEYGQKLSLSYEELDKIINEGKEIGVRFFMFAGGEPLVRKDDIIKLCEKHNDCAFQAFTNGTLVDEEFCNEMDRVGNLSLSISLEGYEDVNDIRRGKGVFKRVMDAMDLLKEHGQIFGTSICYTSQNVEAVTSDEFLDMIIEKGARYSWYFHYMPIGNEAVVELLPTKEQREYMYHRIREIRGMEGGKEIFVIDFQNDGEYVGGCIAGGKNYLHISANGDIEPCVFVHYSDSNIRDTTILEALQKPLFMAYKEGQPFNENHLRPCPMLENPEKLKAMVKKTGAKSTDVKSPEDVDNLCAKCSCYAQDWATKAEELWAK